MLPQLCQFWDTIWNKLVKEFFYKASIGSMKLRLSELKKSDDKAWKIRVKKLKDIYEEVDGVLYYKELFFISEAIWIKLISRYHNDPLARYFSINKTREFIGQKYYWSSLRKDIEIYVKGYDVCLRSKTVKYKPYNDLKSLPILTHWWKDFSIDFVKGIPISIN